MNVEVLGFTIPDPEVISKYMEIDTDAMPMEWIPEFAGRLCYMSFKKPNEKTRANADYIANIINQEHYSVLEHGSVTLFISGVSRSLTHELVRHRHFSFSQLSQRYVTKPEVAVHPTLVAYGWEPEVRIAFDDAVKLYNRIYDALRLQGLSKKEAAQAAREVLPNSTETKITVTGNFRSWREFFQKRRSPAADEQIHQMADLAFEKLYEIAPAMLADLK